MATSWADLIHALSMSGGILLLVVVGTIIVSIVTVNRGAAEMGGGTEHDHAAAPVSQATAAAPAAGKAAKPGAAPAADEINVLQILGFGTALFVLAVLGLFALSLIEHM